MPGKRAISRITGFGQLTSGGQGRCGGGGEGIFESAAISPANFKYQSLGKARLSASRVNRKPWAGASWRRGAALKIAAPSLTSSNMAIFNTDAPANLALHAWRQGNSP